MSENKLNLTNIRSRGNDGYDQMSVIDPITADYYWSEAVDNEIQGDGVATGTSIVTLSVPAGKRFLCMSIMASSYGGAVIKIGHGTLASMTDEYAIDLMSGGGVHLVSDVIPIFVYYNSGTSAVNVVMYAPKTAKGIPTNNDTNHYFDGYIGGIIYGGEAK